MTTLLDIYEAAGLEIDRETGQVKVKENQSLKPFDIVLTVVPTQMNFEHDGEPTVTLLTPRVWDRYGNEFENEVTLPLSGIRLYGKQDQGSAPARATSTAVDD